MLCDCERESEIASLRECVQEVIEIETSGVSEHTEQTSLS